jgi:hypothetical protein
MTLQEEGVLKEGGKGGENIKQNEKIKMEEI